MAATATERRSRKGGLATRKRARSKVKTTAIAKTTAAKPGKGNPPRGRFKRCVKAVTKKGGARSPAAVCAAQERKQDSKQLTDRKRNGFWPFNSFTKTTIYHVGTGDKYSKSTSHKGYAVYQDQKTGDFVVPKLDRDSRFDTKKDAHRFIDSWVKASRNPVTSIGQGSVRADVYALAGGRHQVKMRGAAPQFFATRQAAMKYARTKVYEARNPNGVTGLATAEQMVAGKQSLTSKLLRKITGNRKKNPEGAAAEMYQVFHGLPAEKVVEYRQTEHVHEWLWAVGTLQSLHVSNGKKTITLTAPDPSSAPFEDVVMVAMTEDGKQFHFRGGDQSLPLDGIAEAFDLTEDDVREHMEIGRVTQMTYQTRKVFEDEGRVDVDFFHDLGKEHAENRLPVLVYKPLNPSMDLVGGRYKVGAFDQSIGASPGIVG